MAITELGQMGAGLAIGLASCGVGLGIGIATKGLMESIARQPEISGTASGLFLLGAALAEACAIYAFIIALKLAGFIG
ncbi:ATP synthase F0 subunit C [bacterium]|nr:ATP synthase F0 subunit C [bacterium]